VTDAYSEFLDGKAQLEGEHGFEPLWLPEFLFDFQRALVDWACRRGRAAIFADCGLGKTAMELVWGENVVRKTNGRVLLLTPLAVTHQVAEEAAKFGVEAAVSRDGTPQRGITISNYEKLHLYSPSDFAGVVCDESSILKSFGGATRQHLTEFMRKLPYRLLATATAAPNDFIELGTSSEALGYLGHMDMLNRFDRCVQLFSNPGETVFTPFIGVGSEVYSPVVLGRRGVGAELKTSYYRQACRNVQAAAEGKRFDARTEDLFASEELK